MNYKKVYIDSCIVIYLLEGIPVLRGLAEQRLNQFLAAGSDIWLSELSRLECRVKPVKDNQAMLLSEYDRFFQLSDVHLAPISSLVLERATLIRATTSLKTPDAIHGATAIEYGCDCILTNDFKFRQLDASIAIEVLSA